MTSDALPLGLDLIADRPSIAPRALIATGRALGIAAGALTGTGLLALAWGSVERRMPVLRRIAIDVPAHRGIKTMTILHLSDLHLFPGQEFLVTFLRRVAAEEHIDLVGSTGDNFGLAEGLPLLEDAYEPLLALPGAFVFGSNDYYSAQKKNWGRYLLGSSKLPKSSIPDLPWIELARRFRDAGWLDLSNQAGTLTVESCGGGGSACGGSTPEGSVLGDSAPGESAIGGSQLHGSAREGSQRVSFLGTDDPHIGRDRIVEPDPSWALDSSLRIAVTHAPYTRVLNAFTTAGADLILAGHTHGGQIGVPGFGAIVTNCDINQKYAKGLHRWRAGDHSSLLHVSAGLGTSPYAPVRIATRPEASLLTIRSILGAWDLAKL